jgi:hypothetical protein
MPTMRDVERLALDLPETSKELGPDGRPSYLVNGKRFVFHRKPRKDAPFDDVLVFHVDGAEAKELMLADPRGVFFTTPHWNGYSAVLMHIPALQELSLEELADIVVDAWLARAPKGVAKQWLATQTPSA